MSQEKYRVPDNDNIIMHEYLSKYIKKFELVYQLYDEDKNGIFYKYIINNDTWFLVYISKVAKITTNFKDYTCAFNMINGYTVKVGATENDDPQWCQLGPEILDLEISINGCPKVGGHNCKFCYKNNSDSTPTNMSFGTFRKIIDSFPKSLNQIAFGITGVQTNPDFPLMLQYCRENDIVPNYTLSGADLNDDIIKVTGKYCGAVAVSCYEGNKDLCYNTIKRINDLTPNVHTNMHIVLSKGTLNHIMNVLKDASRDKKKLIIDRKNKKFTCIYETEDQRLQMLRHIVFLRIKPVGRAKNLDTTLNSDIYKQVIDYCNDHNIGYGFDSCSAPEVREVLKLNNMNEKLQYIENCESSRFSSYINVHGEYWHCSFAENDSRIKSINVLNYDQVTDWWNSDKLNQFRKNMNLNNDMECPLFKLS